MILQRRSVFLMETLDTQTLPLLVLLRALLLFILVQSSVFELLLACNVRSNVLLVHRQMFRESLVFVQNMLETKGLSFRVLLE